MPDIVFDNQFGAFDVTPVENMFIDDYMLRASGDFVKVYILSLRQCYHPDESGMTEEKLCRLLDLEPEDVRAAFRYWERQGLMRRLKDNPPTYAMCNVKSVMLNQKEPFDDLYRYNAFNAGVQRLFTKGRLLHEGDTKYLYDWIEVYQLPEKVVLLLVEYLLKKHGPSVKFSTYDSVAREWAEKGIRTEEQAREIMRFGSESFLTCKRILKELGLNHQDPTPEQERMYKNWLELGFDSAAILECCKQTAVAQHPNFGYLDSIIHSMHDKGLHSVREIAEYTDSYKNGVTQLREVFRALGQSMPVGAGGLMDTYKNWQGMGYSHEAILIAAESLSKMGSGTFDLLDKAIHRMKEDGVTDVLSVNKYYDEILTYQGICEMLLERLGLKRKVTSTDMDLVRRWMNEYAMPLELLTHAADRARDVSGSRMAYIDKVLRSWNEHDLRTLDAVSRSDEQRRAPSSGKRTAAATAQSGYMQRDHSGSDLNGMLFDDIMSEDNKGGGA